MNYPWPLGTKTPPVNDGTYRTPEQMQQKDPEQWRGRIGQIVMIPNGPNDPPWPPAMIAQWPPVDPAEALMRRLDRLENALQRRLDFLETLVEDTRDSLPAPKRDPEDRMVNRRFPGQPR